MKAVAPYLPSRSLVGPLGVRLRSIDSGELRRDLAVLPTQRRRAIGEDLPRRQLESGMTFMNGQRYTEALKDFQAIIDSFPKSQVADNALAADCDVSTRHRA